MGRKAQVSRERILQTALDMLLQNGYSAITVKTLAARIGCSTQPILWHFENMAGFRQAFYEYCVAYAGSQFSPWNGSLDSLLTETARGYISIACRMPHLFRFVFAENPDACRNSPAVQSMQQERTEKIRALLCREKGLTEIQAERFLMNYEFYIHGIASYCAGGFVHDPEEAIIAMADRVRDAMLADEAGGSL